jgi:Fe(3+) dicitrate transport protein
VNVTREPGDPLLSQADFSFVPLFSLGAGYVLVEGQVPGPISMAKEDGKAVQNAAPIVAGGPPRLELYATVAQAYRPRTYGELVSTAPDGVVNGDLEEGHSLQFELGVRGKPLPYLTFDLGGFYFEVNDQVGEITGVNADGVTFTTTENVGDARYAGFEAAVELDLLAMINGGTESPYGRFNLYGNVTLLDTEFTSGPSKGFDTTYAPNYQFKTGGIYRWKEIVKVGLLGNMVDDSFADANNTPSHFIPAYTVWDLTAEVKFLHGRLGVFAGIRNLFDEDFYAEIRDEGIVPAYRRNYYGGFSVKF